MALLPTIFGTAAFILCLLALLVLSYVEAFRVDNQKHKETLVQLFAFQFLPTMVSRSLGLVVELDAMQVDGAHPFQGTSAAAAQVLAGTKSPEEFQKDLRPRARDTPLSRDHMDLALSILQDADEAFQRKEAVERAYDGARGSGASAFKQLLGSAVLAALGWGAQGVLGNIEGPWSPMLGGALVLVGFVSTVLFLFAAQNARESWQERHTFVRLAEEKGVVVPAFRLEWRLLGALGGK